ncbi:MAG: Na+/H+ antiporter NhaC [Tissierellaceae bacterium]|nr:Na+/H+ antiporter NhaC [Tissierellaceae bacterium]
MKQEKIKRRPYLWEALISFGFLIVIMGISLGIYGSDPHVPLLIGTAFSSIMALRLGFSWTEIEESMKQGIYQALQAVIILTIIGVLVGVWIEAGVVPAMIYYGLSIISPSVYLPVTMIICSITSLATGTSWGTVGTVGIAMIGIASGLGIPLPIAAGAILSGAYFGDKLSPLSDTTNLAPAVSGTDVFTHIKYMVPVTSISFIISIILFFIVGLGYDSGTTNLETISIIQNGIKEMFNITPILLISPIAVIVAIALKVPAIPGISLGILLGILEAFFIQGSNFGAILSASYYGFVSETGIAVVDNLFTTGGITNMMYAISLTFISMMFGGIMETTGQLEVIVNTVIKRLKTASQLIAATMITCVFSNMTMPEQVISIVVPGRMYAPAYRKMGIHPKSLSAALEASGTMSSSLIPWTACAVYMSTTLGVPTIEYIPWTFFLYITPILTLLLSKTKLVVVEIGDDPSTVVEILSNVQENLVEA